MRSKRLYSHYLIYFIYVRGIKGIKEGKEEKGVILEKTHIREVEKRKRKEENLKCQNSKNPQGKG